MDSMVFATEVNLNIGDIYVALSSADCSQEFEVRSPYDKFVSKNGRVDSKLSFHFEMPSVELGEEIFSCDTWALYKRNGKRIFKLAPETLGPLPIRLGIFNSDFSLGDIYAREDYLDEPMNKSDKHIFPFTYPLDEILILNILSRKSGMITHACGISSNGKGYLFVGSSGAGKSVTADLWKSENRVKIMSDDRIVIRCQEDQLFAYGTPWHGDAKLFSPEKVPLEKIFFLRHAHENKVCKFDPVDAFSRLFVCSFPTFYDAAGLKNTLDLINCVARDIDCYELGFVPEMSVIDYLRNNELVC